MQNSELLAALHNVSNPDSAVRTAAEAALEAAAAAPGFGLFLVNVVLSQDADQGLRQMAGAVLKKLIKERWSPEAARFREPAVGDAEKAQIRALLPRGLGDPNGRVRSAVAMAAAGVAKWDCPAAWPELLPGLVAAAGARGEPHLVAGAVACLEMMVDELGEEHVLEIAPPLLPELLRLAAGDGGAAPPLLRRHAVSVFNSVVQALDALARERRAEVSALLAGALPGWMAALGGILAAPLAEDDTPAWGLKMEALSALVKLATNFGKAAAPHMPPVMTAAWALLVAALPLYERLVVRGEGDGGAADEDAGGVDLELLVAELMEFVLTLLGSRRFRPAVLPALPQLFHLALGFMQLGAAQAERWAADANALLHDEDSEFWTVRACGEMLLDEAVEAAGSAALSALAAAVAGRLAEADAARAAGNPDWWRLREAALAAVGAVAERIVDDAEEAARALPTAAGAAAAPPPALDPARLAAALTELDLQPGAPPFLAGRALWLASRLAPAVPAEARPPLLRAAVAALAPGAPPPLLVGGCQALVRLCEDAAPGELAPLGPALFAAVTGLLQRSTDEGLHLALEALAAAVRAHPEGAAPFEAAITEPALRAWVDNVSDPLLGEDAHDILRQLARLPACLPPMQARLLPTLAGVLADAGAHPALLVEGCLELLVALTAPAAPEAAARAAAAAAPAALALAEGHADDDVRAAAAAFLRTLLQVGGADALGWLPPGGDRAAGLAAVLRAVGALLASPDDDAVRTVGGLVLELLRCARDALAPALPELLRALADRLAAAESPAAVQSLLMVFAQLVLAAGPDQVVGCLAALPAAAGGSALDALAAKWVERHCEVRTPYDIRVSAAALAALLGCRHPALDALAVRGRRLDTEEGGVRTRARARARAERWSTVPFKARAAMLLVDAYIEARVSAHGKAAAAAAGAAAGGGGAGGERAPPAPAAGADSDGGWATDDDEGSDDDGGSDGFFAGLCDSGSDGGSGAEAALAAVDPLEAARRARDPLGAADLGALAAAALRAAAAPGGAPEAVRAAAAELSQTQLAALQEVLAGGGA